MMFISCYLYIIVSECFICYFICHLPTPVKSSAKATWIRFSVLLLIIEVNSGIKPSTYIPITIGSPLVVLLFDKISFPPLINNLEGFMQQLFMLVAISRHNSLYKSNVRFIVLKALLASIWMNPYVATSWKDPLLFGLLLSIMILNLHIIFGSL